MKKLTILLLLICSSIFLTAKSNTAKTLVHFNTDKHELTNKATEALKQFISNNKTDLEYTVTISGHTDNIGAKAYNKNLSKNRAEEVERYLVKIGVDPDLITITYEGELNPDKPNSSDINRGINRRVEVSITSYYFENVSELEDALSPRDKSTFTIDPLEEVVVKGRNGIKVLIQANTFIYEDGRPVSDDVKFVMTESLDYASFINSGLQTKTTDHLLESGGMLKLEATTVKGESVKVRKDQPMYISVPTTNRKEGMEVFSSEKGDTWVARNQPIEKDFVWSQEDFPVLRSTSVFFPTFKYRGEKKPTPPTKPTIIKEPHEPRAESFLRPIPWYRFGKKKILEQQHRSYENSIVRYEKRKSRFERLSKSHVKKMELYDEAYCMYLQDVEAWEDEKNRQKEAFKETPEYQKAADRHNRIAAKNLALYQKEVKQWRLNHQQNMAQQGDMMDKLGVTDASKLNSYVFAFNALRWINVDKFYKIDDSQKQMIVLKTEKLENERVLVMFHDMNSMLSMRKNPITKSYFLEQVPKNANAIIFAYKVKDGRPMIYHKKLDETNNYKLEYTQSSFKEISDLLKSFGQT